MLVTKHISIYQHQKHKSKDTTMKRLLLAALFASQCINAMEMIPASSSEDVRLYTNHRDLFVEDENAAYRIEKYNMNPDLRNVMKHKLLEKFKEQGHFRVTKLSNGEYSITAQVAGKGGTGPITAGMVGFAVRFGCYTAYLVGASTPVVAGTLVAGPAGATAGTAAVALTLAQAGGAAGVIATTEALAMKATLGTLLLPIPLP
jgi:hypothetical protein